MSNNTTGGDEPQSDAGEDHDVTEIVPAASPTSDDTSNPDATQILPMRSAPEPKQQLPGTVIGIVGSGQTNPEPVNVTQETTIDSDDETATKILFNTDVQTNAENTLDGGTPTNKEPAEFDEEPDQTEEKTVFLAPVSKSKDQDDFNPPVGWLVIVDGPGRGAVLDIHYGQNTIGRGDDQHMRLDFGDTQITRETHAFILYDEVQRTFFLRDTGQKNIVRVNTTPVMTPTQLHSHDFIQMGTTTCLFVPLCTTTFDWLGGDDDPATGPPGEDKSS